MADFDVFNGDADGICALHQLRLVEPRQAELVTGVKRDIRLLDRLKGRVAAGDRLTVLDISVEPNADALRSVLDAGSSVQWFDHHFPGDLPDHAGLQATIDLSPEVCTSLLVDRHLGGRYRAWAVVALFGDGLATVARSLAEGAGFDTPATRALELLGEAINYNAYGETVADLYLPPDALYRRLAGYVDPLAFSRTDPIAGELISLLSTDLEQALSVDAAVRSERCIAYVMPDAPWARRISGHFANRIAEQNPEQAIAVLTRLASGHYQVSVRAPKSRPVGADALCRQFPTGGGRAGAAGVKCLAADGVGGFVDRFAAHFSGGATDAH